MNSRVFNLFQRRAFSSLYNYSNPANPKVFMTIARGEQKLGDLVFEVYADRHPATAESFMALCHGETADGRSYVGTNFHHGLSEFGISGGKFGEENLGADGVRMPDENPDMRHHKRGQLSVVSSGLNALGSEFTVTFGEAPTLNGYNAVLGELVEGESVLSQLEAGVNRLGDVTEDFTIVAAGEK